ncbi:hypothetical protein KGF56_002957 [Candida oxycetoniae]|uniref:Uncharacterized protein n=1 Tax=Candida oxycetoniae TaxID=497107 RepID=A0AAI9SW52_9ASCO|nr:uncharacterized protein KGF56_002957 [Candida oxycetoniae]KAI3404196.2 hypothetical protein KGF56_002957 [Candida oxycetoniae]
MSRKVSLISVNSFDENAKGRFTPMSLVPFNNSNSQTHLPKLATFSGSSNISIASDSFNKENLLQISESINSSRLPFSSLYVNYRNENSCEIKLKNMMMEDENYDFIMNPCCDRPTCKFVKNAIIKQNLNAGTIVSYSASIDSELNNSDSDNVRQMCLSGKELEEEKAFTMAPLRTSSIQELIQPKRQKKKNQVAESVIDNDNKNLNSSNDGCSALIEDLDECIKSFSFQSQIDEKLGKLKKILGVKKWKSQK